MTVTGLIAHEWIERVGGAERVLDSFADMFPDADMFCLWNDAPGRFGQRNVRESVLARTPMRKKKALALPLMPAVWNDVGDKSKVYDWMLISSHLFAHQARVPKLDPARKFVYVHTPARYIWSPELDGRGDSLLARTAGPALRGLDRRRAQKLEKVAANSEFVRERIQRTWGIDSTIINPPVEVERLQSMGDWAEALGEHERAVLESLPETFVLGASRFVPYKRLDVVIDAGAAAGIPVVIAGSGTTAAENQLIAHAESVGARLHMVRRPSDELMAALMQRALVYVFPPVEDFGIMPVEAMALGTPVVVNAEGGAAESVIDGVTGAHLQSFSPADLRDGIERALAGSADDARSRAEDFSLGRFAVRVSDWMHGI